MLCASTHRARADRRRGALQSCGKANIPHADYDIRKRLCKACRKSNWVKLYFDVEDLHPELHPRVVQICLYTYRTLSIVDRERTADHGACAPYRLGVLGQHE